MREELTLTWTTNEDWLLHRLREGDALTIRPTAAGFDVDTTGYIFGRLDHSSDIGKLLAGGARIVDVRIESFPAERTMLAVATLSSDNEPVLEQEAPSSRASRQTRDDTYCAAVAGTSYHQAAIARCRVGEPVELLRVLDNPHDPLAIAVISAAGEQIGWVGRGTWLQRVVAIDGRGCTATIAQCGAGRGPWLGVALFVALTDVPLAVRAGAEPPQAAPPIPVYQRPDVTVEAAQPNGGGGATALAILFALLGGLAALAGVLH